MRTAAHLFYGPNSPGMADVAAREAAAREHAMIDLRGAAARDRRAAELRAYPDYARKLAARGMSVPAPRGYEADFELRALARRARLDAAEQRIADALRPAARASTDARLGRVEAALADLRRPVNFSSAPPRRGSERPSRPSPEAAARAERARLT